MAGRINHSTITFTPDHRIGCLHLGHYIHFAHCGSIVLHTIFAGHIAQSTCRAQIRYRITRSMFQYIVGHCDQCIFFTIHHTVLADHGQTVYVRVNNKCDICFSSLHQVHDITQILFQRFGIVGKITGRFAIEFFYVFHSQTFQQFRQNNTPYGVYAIDGYSEVSFLDSFYIYQVKRQYTVDMFFVISKIFAIRTQMINICIIEFFGRSNAKHFLSFGCIQKFAVFVQ